MYIYPNMELKILRNVSLNNDYDHTIFFGSELAQRTFFSDSLRVKYTLSNQQYQRKERGWIQVNLNQNDLWDCTYLMYRNTSYSTKWFYAFILSVEYVNDSVSKINFEIDVIQTWHFNYTLDKCFVEREHTTTDALFENTIEENVDIGKYYNAQVVRNYAFQNTLLIAVVTSVTNVSTPQIYNKVFSGLRYYPGVISGTSVSNDFIDFIQGKINDGKEDEIVAIYQCPLMMGNPNLTGGYTSEDYTFSFYNFVNVDGYVPKNKKLFCYPYNYLSVTDKEGQQLDFKWELWDSSHIGEFLVEGSLIGKPVMAITPKYYRDVPLDRENSMSYDNFPICSWVGDSFSIWLAQNKNSILSSVLTSAPIGIPFGGGQTLYPMGNTDTIGLLRTVTSALGNTLDARNIPDKHHGNLSSSVMHIQNNSSGFEIKQMTIRNEYAKIVDEYFSRFGYACHRIKVPNRNARQNWTYTKTIGCEIVGNVPSDDIVKIKSIYDKGITFWNDGLNVGYYGDFTNPVYS